MRVLGIETATSDGGAALVIDDRMVAERYIANPRTFAENLIPTIDHLLNEAGWKINDLALIAVSAGPGSFTGLRIGIATAKGLAMAARLPIVGVPTLEAYALVLAAPFQTTGEGPGSASGAPAKMTIRPVLDARKDEVFTAPFDKNAQRLGPDINIRPEILVETIKNEGPLLIAGDGARRYRAIFENAVGENLYFAPPENDHPRPSAIAALGRRLLLEGAPSDVDSLRPRYVRRSDAEIHSGREAPPEKDQGIDISIGKPYPFIRR